MVAAAEVAAFPLRYRAEVPSRCAWWGEDLVTSSIVRNRPWRLRKDVWTTKIYERRFVEERQSLEGAAAVFTGQSFAKVASRRCDGRPSADAGSRSRR